MGISANHHCRGPQQHKGALNKVGRGKTATEKDHISFTIGVCIYIEKNMRINDEMSNI